MIYEISLDPRPWAGGDELRTAWRQFGVHAGRPRKGEKPANLPGKFELIS